MATNEISKRNGPVAHRPADFFSAMRNEMEHMFERFEHGLPDWSMMRRRGAAGDIMVPELDVHDNGRQLAIEVELPGVDENDVTVTLANGVLSIKGEKKASREEKDQNYYMAERSYGAFERMLRLPESIDESKLEAKFDKGVLKITAEKKPEAVKAEKRIEVKKA